MREFVKSFFSLGIAVSLFPLKQTQNLLNALDSGEPRDAPTQAMDAVRDAIVGDLGGPLHSAFTTLDKVQRAAVEMGFGVLWPRVSDSSRTQERTKSADDVPLTSAGEVHVFADNVDREVVRATVLRTRPARENSAWTQRSADILADRRS